MEGTRNLRRFAAAACLLGFASLGQAATINFNATFTEQWFLNADGTCCTNGAEAGAGPANTNQDLNTDLFELEVTSADAVTSFNIVYTDIIFDQSNGPVGLDTVSGGFGFDNAYAINYGANGTGASTFAGADGDTQLLIDHTLFGANQAFDFSFDIDNTNAVVRGSNGGGTNSDFAGSTLVVGYEMAGNFFEQAFTFGAGGLDPSATSTAGGSITVPAPGPVALLALALLGMGLRRKA